MPASDRRLLASIHDVGPRFEREVDALADRLERILGGSRFAMLVVPDHWNEAPLSASPSYRRKLRAWSDAGVEMFLHGWCHRDDHQAISGVASFKARHMTAGEGEFLGLSHGEALTRMLRGRKIVEDAIGRSVAGFVAPAWLYGPGAASALRAAEFDLAEDHMRVWNPMTAATLARGPVVTWASRSKARIRSSIAFATIARRALQVMPTVRVAVHPNDTKVPALIDSIERTIQAFLRFRTPATYRELARRTCGSAVAAPSRTP